PRDRRAAAGRRHLAALHPGEGERQSADRPVHPERELMRRLILATIVATLALTASASAHATLSPPQVLANTSQLFTLAVPTEKAGATTTQVELTPPEGFAIDSFAAAPGWQRKADQTGEGEEVQVRKVTWSGGRTPTGEAALFQFVGDV